jgi:hypothetical protein
LIFEVDAIIIPAGSCVGVGAPHGSSHIYKLYFEITGLLFYNTKVIHPSTLDSQFRLSKLIIEIVDFVEGGSGNAFTKKLLLNR